MKPRSRARVPRPRLAVEITAALAVKFVLLFAIWVAFFAHPIGRDLDAARVAAAMLERAPAPVASQPLDHARP